jgi:hypothetical protein
MSAPAPVDSSATIVDTSTTIDVADFRRRNLILRWHALGGTWAACEFPPPLVHGVALISATGPNICLFGQGGRLTLQIGPTQYALDETFPRISCRGGWLLFGLRRRFVVRSQSGAILFSYRYWRGQGKDFLRWLAQQARNPDWRVECATQWSAGLAPTALPRQQSS